MATSLDPKPRKVDREVARARAGLGGLIARGADPDRIEAARTELAAALAAAEADREYVRRLVDRAPPLTPEVRRVLAALLAPTEAGGAA